jgi:hypothetical protein
MINNKDRYNLLDFLIEKRDEVDGMGHPAIIRLDEFPEYHEDCKNLDSEIITGKKYYNKIIKDLKFIEKDIGLHGKYKFTIDEQSKTKLDSIKQQKDNLNEGQKKTEIKLYYITREIQQYKEESKKLEMEAKKRNLADEFCLKKESGGIKIHHKNKFVAFDYGPGSDLCILIFGGTVDNKLFDEDNDESVQENSLLDLYDDYKPGLDFVTINDLNCVLNYESNEDDFEATNQETIAEENHAIYKSLYDVNRKATTKLELGNEFLEMHMPGESDHNGRIKLSRYGEI